MDDWYGVVSMGFYPTPGVTAAQQAHLAGSWGMLLELPASTEAVIQLWRRNYDDMMMCMYNNFRILQRRRMA